MLRITLLALLVPLVLASGCASMNEQECLVTDWRSVGFEDGVAGRSEGSIAGYRQACSKHGVTPDLTAYRTGHAEGVEIYCRVASGFEVGRRGGRYQGVCPAGLEPDFLAAYNQGRQLYELESALRTVDGQIAAHHRRQDQIKKEMAVIAATIVADETTSQRRAELLIESAALGTELVEIGHELEDLSIERTVRETDLFAYRETLALDL